MAVLNKIAETGVKRSTVDHRVNVIRRAFKWAAKEELIPATAYGRDLRVDLSLRPLIRRRDHGEYKV